MADITAHDGQFDDIAHLSYDRDAHEVRVVNKNAVHVEFCLRKQSKTTCNSFVLGSRVPAALSWITCVG